MLTQSDTKLIRQLIKVTVKELLEENNRYLVTKKDLGKYPTKDDFDELKAELKDIIITFKDEIYHEILNLRDDMAVVRGWRDMLEDHEDRIDKIETKLN